MRRQVVVDDKSDEMMGYPRGCGCNVAEMLQLMIREQRDHNYHKFGETYIKYRKVVAEWMIEVCTYFNLHITTTHSAIAYLDRLQPNEKFSRFEWQMLAICCILVASKYNESEEHVPDLRTLEDISQQNLSKETILNYELWALKRMGWKLNARVPVVFLVSYMQLGICFDDDAFDPQLLKDDDTIESLTQREIVQYASTCILNASLKSFRASDIACAILYMVRRSLDIKPIWREELTQITSNDPLNTEVSEIIFLLGAVFTPTTMFEPSVASDSHDTFTPTKSNDLSVVTSHDVTPEQDKENRNINQKHELMVSPDGVVAALEFN